MLENQETKVRIIIEAGDSRDIRFDSNNYPEFSGKLFKEFLEFLHKKGENLSNIDCRNQDLSQANLYKANLYKANLEKANLIEANLEKANLREANLYKANLIEANLIEANLYKANLIEANLIEANLREVNLREVNLIEVNLIEANLEKANLREANLPFKCKWDLSFTIDKKIKIGCKEKTIEEWKEWFKSNEEYSTKRNTLDFVLIEAMFLAQERAIQFLEEKGCLDFSKLPDGISYK